MHELPAREVPVVDHVPGGHASPCGESGSSPVAGASVVGVLGAAVGAGQVASPGSVAVMHRSCPVEPGRGA
jgi:hypothetical protein